MESNAEDRALPVPRIRNGRPPAGQPRSHGASHQVQAESIEATNLLKEPVGMGRLLTAEKQQAVMLSFEPLIDSSTAAGLLKVHRKTLERMALRGEIPGHKIGKFWRFRAGFRASELDEWLRSGVNSGRQPCCTTTF